jgi:hypothetical protein
MRTPRWVILVLLAVLTLLLLSTAVLTYRSTNPPHPTLTPMSGRDAARFTEARTSFHLIVTTDSPVPALRLLDPHHPQVQPLNTANLAPTIPVAPFYVRARNQQIALYFYP